MRSDESENLGSRLNEMHTSDRETRFMTARDLTQEILESGTRDELSEKRVVEALVSQLLDRSREVSLNAIDCLERLYLSKSGAFEETILSSILNQFELPGLHAQAHEMALLRFLQASGFVPSPRLSTKLTNTVIGAVRSNPSDTLFNALHWILQRYGKPAAGVSSDLLAVLVKSITNRHACNSLACILTQLDDEQFEGFITKESLEIPNCSFVHLALSLSRTDQFHRLIPFIESIVLPRSIESLRSDETVKLVPAITLVHDLLLLRSAIDDRKLLSHVDRVLPLLRSLLSFGLGSTNCQYEDDEESDYFDDEDDSWEVRRAVVKLVSAIVAAPDSSSPWIPKNDSDFSKILRHEFEPVFLKQLDSLESDELVLMEVLMFFNINSVSDSLLRDSLKTVLSARARLLRNKSKCRPLLDEITGKLDAPILAICRRPPVRCPNVVIPEEFLTRLSELEGNISNVDDVLVMKITQLCSMIVVDESCVKLVDLGAFKHREDPDAPRRKLALSCIDSIFKKLERSEVQFDNVTAHQVVECGIKTILQTLTIDMNNGGEDLYPIVVSLIRTLTEINASRLVEFLPEILNRLEHIVDNCPMAKRDGLTMNHAGVVLGQLVIALIDVLQLVARDRGISVKTLIKKEFVTLSTTRLKIARETTEGSILHAASQIIGDRI